MNDSADFSVARLAEDGGLQILPFGRFRNSCTTILSYLILAPSRSIDKRVRELSEELSKITPLLSPTSYSADDMPSSSVKVHRCRFVDAVPQAVECVEFDPRGGRLAVLRANADIEVWSLALGGWFCESRLAGAADAPVRRVAWGAQDPAFPRGRLSAGRDVP